MSHFILRSAEPSSINISPQQTRQVESSPFIHHETSTYSIRTTSSTSAGKGYPVFINTDQDMYPVFINTDQDIYPVSINTDQDIYPVFINTDQDINQKIEKVEREKPKTSSLLRTFKGRPKVTTVPKNVRWSEQVVRIVDDETYIAHKTLLLNLQTPNDSSKSAAIESVLFMCDIDEGISQSLIDMAWKIFWIKQKRYPSGSELYTVISDVNYDERKLVLEFIREYDTAKGKATISSLLDDPDDNSLSETDDHSCLRNCIRQTDATSLLTSCKTEYPSAETKCPSAETKCPSVCDKLNLRKNTVANQR